MGHCKGGPHMSYSPNKMGHESPTEMGYSPMENQNKGYAKQKRKDLMQDMPIVKDAMGGRSWMSKHSRSAFQMGHSPAKMHGGDHDDDKKLKNIPCTVGIESTVTKIDSVNKKVLVESS